MFSSLVLPILSEIVKGGITYGSSLLVEFEPDSMWFEASLTMIAQGIRGGIRCDYHTFQHEPSDVRAALSRLGLAVKELEDADSLRILNSYTIQTGLVLPDSSTSGRVPRHYSQSLKLQDWSIADVQRIKSDVPQEDKRRLHIDDNTGILLQYNDEKVFIDNWRTRSRPHTKVQEIVLFNSLVKGVASDNFTKQFEALSDGIIDFKSEESAGQIEHTFRVRTMRGRPHDSRWHRLRLMDNGEVISTDL